MLRPAKLLPSVICCFLSTTPALSQAVVVGGLGDSVTAGFNAASYGDNRTLSWSTGTAADVTSFRHLLERTSGLSVDAVNEATAGSTVANLPRQVTRLLRSQPDIVTITLGANDVCKWPADHSAALAHFTSVFYDQIIRLIAARPRVKLLVAGIPDVYRLYAEAVTHQGCQEKWDVMQLCPSMLRRDVTLEQRERFRSRWRAANAALASLAASFPDHVHFVPAISEAGFVWQHISPLDCFHPSAAGQSLLAQLVWQAYLDATATGS